MIERTRGGGPPGLLPRAARALLRALVPPFVAPSLLLIMPNEDRRIVAVQVVLGE